MKRIAALTAASMLAGCATADWYQPVVDTKGIDGTRYAQDLAECRQYAVQRDPANQAVAGAVAGALLGVLLGAATGTSRNYGASVGAASGVAAGAAHGADSQVQIIRRCLLGRGYQVLD
jgi:outer membrane lipoprotein SlyB